MNKIVNKEKKVGEMFKFVFGLALLLMFQVDIVFAQIQINGKITAKRNDTVQIAYEPHKTVRPAKGDKVDFSIDKKGVKINAGSGVVLEVHDDSVQVKITKNRPGLKMNAVIFATGLQAQPEQIAQSSDPQ